MTEIVAGDPAPVVRPGKLGAHFVEQQGFTSYTRSVVSDGMVDVTGRPSNLINIAKGIGRTNFALPKVSSSRRTSFRSKPLAGTDSSIRPVKRCPSGTLVHARCMDPAAFEICNAIWSAVVHGVVAGWRRRAFSTRLHPHETPSLQRSEKQLSVQLDREFDPAQGFCCRSPVSALLLDLIDRACK